MVLNVEKVTIENLENEMKYIFNNISEKNCNKLLSNFIKLLFEYNNIKISISTIRKTFIDFGKYIYYNILDNIIKSIDDMKYYILDEINLIIPNNEYLYFRFMKDDYKEFNNNFEFVVI